LLAVTVMALVACAAISTIALIVVVSRPTRPVLVQQPARVQTWAHSRVIASRPAVAPRQAVAALTAATLDISDVVTPRGLDSSASATERPLRVRPRSRRQKRAWSNRSNSPRRKEDRPSLARHDEEHHAP
jgi:hypothetical protein